MLRHAMSFKANKKIDPGELFFLVKKWLVKRSGNSGFTEEDFEVLSKTRDFIIEKEKEKLTGLMYNENGLSLALCDYQYSAERGIYLVSVVVLRNPEGDYVSCRLYTFAKSGGGGLSGGLQADPPGIFRMLVHKAGGGMNGNIPLKDSPVIMGHESVMEAFERRNNPLILPVVYIDTSGLIFPDPDSLAKVLYGKASVVCPAEYEKTSSEKRKFIGLKLLTKRVDKKAAVKILYPDGNISVVKYDKRNKTEEAVVLEVLDNQSRQYFPADIRFVFDKKKRLNQMNYAAPNHYCRSVFEITAGLMRNERDMIRKSIRGGMDFEDVLKEILILPEDIKLFTGIRRSELMNILKIAETV